MILSSAALRAAIAFGVSGVAFAVANLALAATLEPAEYGRFSLFLALVLLGAELGPVGADGVINRYRLRPSPRMLIRTLISSAFVGAISVAVALNLYQLTFAVLPLIFITIVAQTMSVVAAAHYQSVQRFRWSLAVSQAFNGILFVAAALTVLGTHSAFFTAWFLAMGVLAWSVGSSASLFFRHQIWQERHDAFPWLESIAFVGMRGAAAILVVTERLTVPRTLSFEALATFGVLASLAGAPFRMLQQGVGFTLLPKLRMANSAEARRHVLRHELLVVAFVAGTTAIVLLIATVPVVSLIYGDRYPVTTSLVLAMVLAGHAKVVSTIAVSAGSALGTARQLAIVSTSGWIAVGIAIAGAIIGARWGLTGVIYGTSLGWLVRAIVAGWISAPYFFHGVTPSASSHSTG